MRLGLLIYGSLDTLSGGYLYDRKLVEYLRGAGDEVEITSLPWRNYARHFSDNFSAALLARLRLGRWDVLLQDELNHPSLFWLNGRWRRHGPIISIVHHLRSSEHHPAWQKGLYRWIERRYLASVDGFIFNSRATQAAVESLVGGAGPSVVAHPAGNHFTATLDEAQIRARASQPGPLRMAFVGNIIPRKNLFTLLRAAARLPKECWQLSVVGSLAVDAAHARAIGQHIQRNGLSNNVTLHGVLSDAKLSAELAHAHVLVVPSEYEGFGIVYLEGMSFGLPAIASAAGAAHEIITPGENGFLIAPHDVEALAAHLRELADDRERLARMSLAALARFRAHPTWEASAARIRQYLCERVENADFRDER
jgi:glycosyltransferase involved in cell wall biosynthesis